MWGLGALAMVTRLLRHAIRLRSIIRTGARPPTNPHQPPNSRWPLAGGLFRQVILLPENSATWNASRRRARLRTRRPLTCAMQRSPDPSPRTFRDRNLLVPSAVLVRPRPSSGQQSERACDDTAPSQWTTSFRIRRAFARTSPENLIFHSPYPWPQLSHLESHVKHILDPGTNRSPSPDRATWAAAFVLTACDPHPTIKLFSEGPGARRKRDH